MRLTLNKKEHYQIEFVVVVVVITIIVVVFVSSGVGRKLTEEGIL